MMSGRRDLGLVIAFIIGFVFWFGVREALAHASELGYEPSVLHAKITGPHAASLSLSTWPDSMQCHGSGHAPGGGAHPDWVSYCPSTTLQVPANSTITVTIKNYDAGDTVKNPFFDRVRGTIGGVEYVNGKATHGFKPTDDVAHTFTVQSVPDSPVQMFISAPMAPVKGGDNAPTPLTINGSPYPKPMVMTFKFHSGRPGNYIWKCYVPCGSGLEDFQEGFGGPMSTTGYMAGTLHVG
jgi:hypothetical protein